MVQLNEGDHGNLYDPRLDRIVSDLKNCAYMVRELT